MCIYTSCTDKLSHCSDSLHPRARTGLVQLAGRKGYGRWTQQDHHLHAEASRHSPLGRVLFLLAVQLPTANTCRIPFNCCPGLPQELIRATVQAALARGLTCLSCQLLGLCSPFINTETLAFPSPSASRESISTRTPTHRCVRLFPHVFTVYPFFFRHTQNVLLSELSLPVTLQ